jgi:hypothetical protein
MAAGCYLCQPRDSAWLARELRQRGPQLVPWLYLGREMEPLDSRLVYGNSGTLISLEDNEGASALAIRSPSIDDAHNREFAHQLKNVGEGERWHRRKLRR